MQKQRRISLLIVVMCVLAPIITPPPTAAATQRHLVVHGGLSRASLADIARNVNTLIISNYRLTELEQLKRYNPNLILLRYHHALGARPNSPEWAHIDPDESMFVHDAATGRRLVERRYDWRLLNNAAPQWRRFLCERILGNTEAIFDGVFIDDFWIRYVEKFVVEDLRKPARPAENIINDWQANMAGFLTQLRTVYPKQIFINGAHPEYMELVDGCMDEGFVHGNWESDATYPNRSDYLRSLLRIERLKPYGKTLLVQSGTSGDLPANIENIFRLCAASYFLIAGPHTSFGFHPLKTYDFRNFPVYDNYQLDLGAPRSGYYVFKQAAEPLNLIPNGDFSHALQGWEIITGHPSAVELAGADGPSISFQSRPRGSDRISSDWVPVTGGTAYRIFARCKSEQNRAGSAPYKKLGLQGRFYDINKQKLSGAFDLQFAPGTYDWLPFEITHTSPARAAFFRVRLGFIDDGSGKGWIDEVRLTPAPASGILLRRDFDKGSVTVNYGLPDIPLHSGPGSESKAVDDTVRGLKPIDGKIMLFERTGRAQ